MARGSLRNSPLLAALLGTVVTGLGHFYLRRWLRALGWLGLTVTASVLFVPDSVISAIGTGTLTNPLPILPIILISAASALDAYLIAKTKVQTDRAQAAGGAGSSGDDESPPCPACGKPVDPDLEFCHWCTTEFVHADELQQPEEKDLN